MSRAAARWRRNIYAPHCRMEKLHTAAGFVGGETRAERIKEPVRAIARPDRHPQAMAIS